MKENNNRFKLKAVTVSLLVASSLVLAGGVAVTNHSLPDEKSVANEQVKPGDDKLQKKLISEFERQYQGLVVLGVNKTPSSHIVALYTNHGLIYVDEQFKIVFKGELFNAVSGENLSKKDTEKNKLLTAIKTKDQSELSGALFGSPEKSDGTSGKVSISTYSEDHSKMLDSLKKSIGELQSPSVGNRSNSNSLNSIFDAKEPAATSKPVTAVVQAEADKSKQAVNKDHVDVDQIEDAGAFIFYKNNKITKVGFDNSGNKLSAEESNKQVAKIVKNIKDKGDSWSIKYPAVGEEKTSIFVFTDPTCGYCQKMHNFIGDINKAGVSVYYLFYPRYLAQGANDFNAKDSIRKMQTIWCSQDNARAMDAIYGGGFINPANNPNICDDKSKSSKRGQFPGYEQYLLGHIMGLSGTPLIVKENGEMITGFVGTSILLKNILN